MIDEVLQNQSITGLGYRLELCESVSRLGPLLEACKLPQFEVSGASRTEYLVAATRAGGVAASVGWSLYSPKTAILHSLAVAPTSRGSGIGASVLAGAMLHLRETLDVEGVYLRTSGAVGFFGGFGFVEVGRDELPIELETNAFATQGEGRLMARQYGRVRPGLDQCAFCLIHNTTPEATLPTGSVFWFRQIGAVLEAQYRGGTVTRGHLLGARDGESLRFVWQHCTEAGRLMRGEGEIFLTLLEDGRRELREQMGDVPGELLLREL